MFEYKVIRKAKKMEDRVVYVTTDFKDAIEKAASFMIDKNNHFDNKNSNIYNYIVEKYEEKEKYGILRVSKNKQTDDYDYGTLMEYHLTKKEALKHINEFILYPERYGNPMLYDYFYKLVP